MNAEDVGAFHTDAFERLADIHAVKKPVDREGLRKNSVTLALSYCNKDVLNCQETVERSSKHIFEGMSAEPSYPENFDPRLKEAMDKVEFLLQTLTTDSDIDDIVSELASIKASIEYMKDAEKEHKIAVLSAISVAMESSKLWHEVYNDSAHALYGMHLPSYYHNDIDGNRRLEEAAGIDLVGIAMADVTGAIEGGLSGLESGDPTAIVIGAAMGGFFSSLDFFNGVVVPGGVGYDCYYEVGNRTAYHNDEGCYYEGGHNDLDDDE